MNFHKRQLTPSTLDMTPTALNVGGDRRQGELLDIASSSQPVPKSHKLSWTVVGLGLLTALYFGGQSVLEDSRTRREDEVYARTMVSNITECLTHKRQGAADALYSDAMRTLAQKHKLSPDRTTSANYRFLMREVREAYSSQGRED